MYSIASTASYFMTRKVKSKARPQIKRNRSIIVDPNGKELRINVSGFVFRIHESYLKQYPKTLLGSERKEAYYDNKNSEYFFDRDPHIFRFILRYYRTGKLHYSNTECCEAFADELTFFRIKHDGMAASCCGDPYNAYCMKVYDLAKSDDSSNKPLTFREQCWKFCEDPTFSFLSKVFYYLSCLVITLSIVMNTIETVSCEAFRNGTMIEARCGDAYPDLFFKVDTVCIAFFTTEYLIRFYGAAERWKYVKSVMSIIDVLAILPYFFDLIMMHLNISQNSNISNILVALRSVRIMRVFKLARHSHRLRELSASIARSTSELGFILFMYLNVVIIFATCIYYAENTDGRESEFVSIPEAMWYTVVTTTTLGYGDIVPHTIQGKLIGSLCCLMGVLVIALPVPIIQMKYLNMLVVVVRITGTGTGCKHSTT